MLNIFINTWGNYNENGADGGEWITLPMEAGDLAETLGRIAKNMGDFDPEFFVNDYEFTTEFDIREIGEMENISDLNDEMEELSSLDEWECKEILAAIDAFGYSFKEAYERQQRGCFIFYPDQDLNDVAAELADEWLNSKDIPDFIARYFDYDAFARDLSFDGYTETYHGVICDN